MLAYIYISPSMFEQQDLSRTIGWKITASQLINLVKKLTPIIVHSGNIDTVYILNKERWM